jgi:hypothetical protein
MMPKLKLTYFDMHGGRGEPVRLALTLGGVAFEDHRFAYPQFAEIRKTVPFGQVPVLEVDGVQTQCKPMRFCVTRVSWPVCIRRMRIRLCCAMKLRM